MIGGSRSLGTLALIATAALWGSNHVVARAARNAAPLPALVFWRWLLAVAILTVIAWPALRRGWLVIRPRLGELTLGGAVGIGLFSFFLMGGADESLAIEIGFINATTPVWVVLLGVLLGGTRPTSSAKIGLALAFAGTLMNGVTCEAAILYLTPLCTAPFSFVSLGEQLAWYHAAEIVAIFAGLLLLGRPPIPTPATP